MTRARAAIIITPALVALASVACMGQPEPYPPSVDHGALAEDASEAMIVVSEMAYAFGAIAEEQRETEVEGSEVGERGLDGIGGEPADLDGEPPCTTFEWSITDPLRLAVHFDACPLPEGGTVDGSASVWLDYDGVRGSVGVDFDELAYGSCRLDGFMVLSADRSGAVRFDSDVEYEDADSEVRLVLTGATVTAAGGAVTVNGSGSLTDHGLVYAIDAHDLRWDDLESCYPTSGSMDLQVPGYPPTTLTYSVDGLGTVVLVEAAGLPPFEIRPTCPGA